MIMNFANRTLFHNDNLKILRAIDSNTINHIATDPPFNKDKDSHTTPGITIGQHILHTISPIGDVEQSLSIPYHSLSWTSG